MKFINHPHGACRQWAVCAFDDIIEFTGPAAGSIEAQVMPIMISLLMDTEADVRQAAAYGLGVAAQFGGEAFLKHCIGNSWRFLIIQMHSSPCLE
jgi:hypothetical protein